MPVHNPGKTLLTGPSNILGERNNNNPVVRIQTIHKLHTIYTHAHALYARRIQLTCQLQRFPTRHAAERTGVRTHACTHAHAHKTPTADGDRCMILKRGACVNSCQRAICTPGFVWICVRAQYNACARCATHGHHHNGQRSQLTSRQRAATGTCRHTTGRMPAQTHTRARTPNDYIINWTLFSTDRARGLICLMHYVINIVQTVVRGLCGNVGEC